MRMPNELQDIARRALNLIVDVNQRTQDPMTAVNVVHGIASVPVSIQRSIWRAHSRLDDIEKSYDRMVSAD